MINKFELTTILLSIVLLSGCGGGNETTNKNEKTITEQISERDGVFVIHGSKKAFCELFKDILIKESKEEAVTDIIIDSPANTVNCSTYGKSEGINCENESLANMLELTEAEDITVLEDKTKACVIGLNKK